MGMTKYIAYIINGEELSATAVNNTIELDKQDQIIVSNNGSCTNTDHISDCEIVNTVIDVERNKALDQYIVEMSFCKECGAYYIPRNSYDYLCKKGKLKNDIKGGVRLFVEMRNGPDYNEENKQFNSIKSKLEKELDHLPKPRNYREIKEESENGMYSFSTLQRENEEARKRRDAILEQIDDPYYGRLDIECNGKKKTYYIGKVQDKTIGGLFVHSSWGVIGSLFNEHEKNEGNINGEICKVTLRRNIKIRNRNLISVTNVFSNNTIYAEKGIYDKFLIQVLMSRKKSHHLTDIITSIQKKQREIIEKAFVSNIIVQGCAGSGKTMVLLHRLSYWLYNNKTLKPNKIKILTPSENFNTHIRELHSELKLREIDVLTIPQYYLMLLNKYSKEISDIRSLAEEENYEERFVNYIYSKQFKKQFISFYYEIIKEYQSKEDVKFIVSCASKCGVPVLFDINKRESDGEYLTVLSVLIHSIYNKNIARDNELKRLQNQFEQENEVLRLNNDTLQGLMETLNDYSLNYKEELKNLLIKDNIVTKKKLNEINALISEIEESDPNDENLENYYKEQADVINKLSNYEKIYNVIDNSYSIDALHNLIKDKRSFKKYSVVYDYIAEYIKTINIYNEKQRLVLKNERDRTETEKKLSLLEVYLTTDEGNEIKKLAAKYPEDITMHIFNKVYDKTIEKKLEELELEKHSEVYRFDLYVRLIFSQLFWNKTVGEDEILCIDEGQDVSYYEYELIIDQNKNNNAYYSVYGDLNQRIKYGRGLNTWEQLSRKLLATIYELNENYRNTNQVTQYCNDIFGFNMILTGVDGDPVRNITFDEMLKEIKNVSYDEERIAVLLPRTISKKRITSSNQLKEVSDHISTKYDSTKISVMYVDEIKGIEFNTVYVMEDDMERNEKYIAFTRSLDKLTVVH